VAVDVQIHVSVTSALVAGECLASRLSCFTSRKRSPGTLCVRSWTGPTAGLDDGETGILDTSEARTPTPQSFGPARLPLTNNRHCSEISILSRAAEFLELI
jgi:hypothetical protein